MNIVDWLNLNPHHRVTLSSDQGTVVASLFGGEGIDQRLLGKGDDDQEAMRRALESRDAIKSTLP
jgi:hypothetical protein